MNLLSATRKTRCLRLAMLMASWVAIPWWTTTAMAQPARDARVVLSTGGPTSAVRVVAFSADSRKLYVAGADKSVEIWGLTETRGNAPDLKLLNHARWPIARHDRGQIWTLAVNDTQSMIAFGGYGAQQISGDISIADSSHGKQLTILPPPRANEDPQQRFITGHLQTVNSVSFSPNGEWLASFSLDGDLRLWSVRNWDSQPILRVGQNPSLSSVYLQFISNTQFVASLSPPADQNKLVPQLKMFTIGPQSQINETVLKSPHKALITALGRETNSNRWFSGDANGEIAIWEGSQNGRTIQPLRKIPVRSISGSGHGHLLTLHSPTAAAIAAGGTDLPYAELRQFTAEDLILVEQREWNVTGETLAAAISADGKYAAMTRPGEAAVEVFALTDPKNNQLRPKPLTTQRPTILAGSGATVRRVQFVKEPPTMLAISTNANGEWTHGFNLATSEVVGPNAIGPNEPAHPATKWTIEAGPSFEGLEQLVTIKSPAGETGKILLSHQRHGHYASHCWIFEKDKAEPSAIAIGTLRQNGIFIYDLRKPGQATPLRYYRDHTNEVNSLSQSVDGKYLASSSLDQTVRIWSLNGLFARPAKFAQAAAWGGDFEIRNGQLLVASLLEFGILHSRRLKDGDQIQRIRYSKDGKPTEINDPEQVLTALSELPLTESVLMYPSRPDAEIPPVIVTPGWEPMATLFIDRRNEWAVWTPAGYYNASVEGDEVFGFHVNPATRGGEVQFSRAEQLREDFERPKLLKELFALSSFAKAANAIAIVPKNFGQVVAQLPQVRISAPEVQTQFPLGAEVTISADVDYGKVPANEFRVEAALNGSPLDAPASSVIAGIGRYTWTILQPPGEYQVMIKVTSNGPSLKAETFSDTRPVPFKIAGKAAVRTVHLLAIGASNYRGNLKLDFCVNDANEFVNLIKRNAGPHYRVGKEKIVVDDSVEGAGRFQSTAFQAEINAFADEIKQTKLQPQDIVMIFVAGHGDVVGTEFFFVPPVAEIETLAQPAIIQRHSIPWSVFRGFAQKIPICGKVFFLDTCYSGSLASLESEKARLRPLKRLNSFVFAGTSEDQKVRDDPTKRHGRFTSFLLEGLSGLADGSTIDPELAGLPPAEPDGKVSLLETVGYVSRQVSNKWKNQRPQFTPLALIRFMNEPIIDIPNRPEN